ncbi:MAG: ribose 5-phosphate isomerase B [bacterium]|nr:ribose 5-phosphate isomerase B [bacterium]
MKVYIGCDHAGFFLKEEIKKYLEQQEHEIIDFGAYSNDSVDYPDHGFLVAKEVANHEESRGILVCGTGIGMSIVANKVNGIRAALCHNIETAKLAREHNHANVLVLGSKIVNSSLALDMVRVFLTTEALGDRHKRRIEKVNELDKKIAKQ